MDLEYKAHQKKIFFSSVEGPATSETFAEHSIVEDMCQVLVLWEMQQSVCEPWSITDTDLSLSLCLTPRPEKGKRGMASPSFHHQAVIREKNEKFSPLLPEQHIKHGLFPWGNKPGKKRRNFFSTSTHPAPYKDQKSARQTIPSWPHWEEWGETWQKECGLGLTWFRPPER